MEAVAQRFGFDLLETPWAGLCMVECAPEWAQVGDAVPSWRGVARPPPYQTGLRQVEVKTVVALGCPCGQNGELTTIFFSGKGDLKVPRRLLPNWLIRNLVTLMGKFIYQRTIEIVAKFDTSEHGKRLRNADASSFYSTLNKRIAKFVEARPASRL
mmetsp:Transcript_113098/g.305202  ORF Transcript_113098/g.305202 Transcript_113098/m.305202 type:complete len:156 (+) Transcript_113098:409-876(+)